MMIVAIRNTNIAATKIAAITYTRGTLLIDVGGRESLDWDDPDGSLYDSAMKQWRDFLGNQEAQFMEAVQYGIVLAADRGSICSK